MSYNLTLNDDNKWTMVEANIEWLLNIVITPPYVMMGKAHNITKIIYSGIILGAYIPSKRKSVVVSPLPENSGYMLYSRPAVKKFSLNLVTEFNDITGKENLSAIPNLSMLIIEVLFGDALEDAFKILPGLLN